MMIDDFLRLCSHAAIALGIAEATLSTRMLGDGKRLALLRAGRDIGARRMESAVEWIDQHWPAGVEWPADVPRPVVEAPVVEVSP